MFLNYRKYFQKILLSSTFRLWVLLIDYIYMYLDTTMWMKRLNQLANSLTSVRKLLDLPAKYRPTWTLHWINLPLKVWQIKRSQILGNNLIGLQIWKSWPAFRGCKGTRNSLEYWGKILSSWSQFSIITSTPGLSCNEKFVSGCW